MTRRILAVTIALLVATVGTVGVLYYALSADARARARINDAVTVAVAAQRIPAGTTGAKIRADSLVRLLRMPRTSVPADSLHAVDAAYDREVVTSDIAAGQVLLAANFGAQTTVTSGLSLPDGKMAVTVQTGVPEQVAGYVRPGSQVAIFYTYKVLSADLKTETKVVRTRLLLPKVEVVTVGTYSPPSSGSGAGQDGSGASRGGASGTLLVTLAVDQTEAERLVLALNTGSLYLGLLTDTVTVSPGTGVQNIDAGGGLSPIFK